MKLKTYLQNVQARLENATKGPWKHDSCGDVWSISVMDTESEDAKAMGGEIFFGIGTTRTAPNNPDAELIANAPTDLKTLLEIIEVLSDANEFYALNKGLRINHKTNKLESADCEDAKDFHGAKARQAQEKIKKMLEDR